MIDLLHQQLLLIAGTSWLLLPTLAAYGVGLLVFQKAGRRPLAHPLIIAAPLIFLAVTLAGASISDYLAGNGVLRWLLGPATVALAVPLSRQVRHMAPIFRPLSIMLLTGGVLAALLTQVIGKFSGLDDLVLRSIAAKSVTTPIGIALTESFAGLVAIIAVVILITGWAGIASCDVIFRRTGLNDDRWQGLILGITAHALGTAHAFQISARCGAFSTLGMGITGLWTSLFLPPLLMTFGLL